jgi:hypothetical protein
MDKEFIEKNIRSKSGRILEANCLKFGLTLKEVYNIYFPGNYKCICGKERFFLGFGKGYRKTCNSKECNSKLKSLNSKNSWESKSSGERDIIQGKRETTCLERYGETNPMKDKDISTKTTITWNNKSKEEITKIDKKRKITKLKKYGNEKHVNLDKMKQTKFERYGNENYNNPVKNHSTRQTSFDENGLNGVQRFVKNTKKAKLEKYEDENYNNPSKHKETCKLKYGVENFSQSIYASNGYKWHDYELPSGKIIRLQGYENKLLDELLKEYSEDEILTHRKDMPEFWYTCNEGKRRRYFPDVYIPKTNTIYEVKSDYTLMCNKEINELKFQSVIDGGYKFELKVY